MITIALLCAALPGCARRTEAPAPPGSSGAEAARLEGDGRWLEAAALHRRDALDGQRGDGDEAAKRAIADYLMAGRVDEAERFAEEVLARDPGAVEVLYYLGDGQRVLMRHEDALRTLRRLLERKPSHARGTFALAGVLARLGMSEEAISLYGRFLEMPDAPAGLRSAAELELARALRRLGRNAEAAGRLASILEAAPHDLTALAEAAQVFGALGNQDVAKALGEEHAWLFGRGHLLSSDDESKIFATGPRESGAEARRALQAADRRELLAALETLERLHAAEPGDREIGTALARLCLRLQRASDALRSVDAALAVAGGPDAGLLELRADALAALDRRAEARESRRQASALLAGSPQALSPREAAAIHLRAGLEELEPGGDLTVALACFERAERALPADWRAITGRARIEIARGDIPRALSLLREAAERGGRDAIEVRRWTAAARGLAGDLRLAAREIMALIKEDPRDLESFHAFEAVFGARAAEPEVARVLQMKAALEGKRDARAALVRTISATPLRECGPRYLEAGRLAFEAGDREQALDGLFLAADLEPLRPEPLELAARALVPPRDAFLRLRTFRRVLERAPWSPEAVEGIVRTYLDLGVRLDAAEALALRWNELVPGERSARLLALVRERRQGPPSR